MKRFTCLILTVCLSFSLLVPFSFSVFADTPESLYSLSEPQRTYVQNYDYSVLSDYLVVFVDDVVYMGNVTNFVLSNVTITNYQSVSREGAVSQVSGSRTFNLYTSNALFFVYNSKYFVNVVNSAMISNEFFSNQHYRIGTLKTDLYNQFFIPGSITSYPSDMTITGSTDAQGSGQLSCLYKESTGDITCALIDSDYSYNLNIDVDSFTSTFKGTTVTLFKHTQSILLDDYYTGYIDFDSSVNFDVSDSNAICSGGNVYFQDTNHITFSTISTSASVPDLVPQITGYEFYLSRDDTGYFYMLNQTIIDQLHNLGNFSEDLTNSTDDLKNQDQKLDSSINEYDQLESEFIDQSSAAMDQVDTSNPLFGVQSFVNTAQWVSARVTDLYESNSYIAYLVVFGLLTGLSLFVVGRRWK